MSSEHSDVFLSELESAVSSFGIDALTDRQAHQLGRHYSMLIRWNKKLNLTRITDPEQAARLHYAESLFGAQFIARAQTLLDIGSGAGFPAIPLAVARPDVQVTALEANQKKSLFLKEAKDELELANLKVVTGRLEEFDWTGYEVLTSRALDRADALLPALIASLNVRQRLMVFSTRELVVNLENRLGEKLSAEAYPIPHSQGRLIAVFTREDAL